MKTLHLATLRTQGTSALTSASSALAAQQARLDCSGVQRLTREQLTALFAAIPADWDIADLHTVIIADTLSEPLAQQLGTWVDVRLGRADEQALQEPPPVQTTEAPPQEPAPPLEAAEETSPRTAVDLRTDLEAALINDLRGPCDGAEEIVDERNVRGRYVVGLLAPKRPGNRR
jgi:hypothetical protein